MESVSEDGSSDSQDWRGEQKKPVRSALTVEQEDFKTLEDKGDLEQPEQKDVLDFKKDPITIKEVEEGNEEFIRKRDAETGVPKALGEEYDYLSSTTEDILDNLPSEIDDNYAFQFIEQKKNDLLNKQGKEYFNKMLSDSSKAYLDRGDASAMEEAEDFVKRDYLKSMRNMGINSLGLDSDKIDEAKQKLDEYYQLRQIPYQKRTPEQNAKVYELKDYVKQFREDSEKFFINPETGKIDGEKRKLVNDLEAKYAKEAKTDFQKFSSRYKQEYDNINAIDNSMVDAYFGDKLEEAKGEFGLYGKVSVADIAKMAEAEKLPEGAEKGKINSLLEEKEKSELNFNALSRALLLNENPAAVAKGWGEFFNAEDSEFNIPFLDKIGEGITSFGESFVEAIPGVGNVGTDRDFRKDIVRIANEEGVTLTEEQYDSAVDNMTEQIGGLFGTSGEIMAEIIVTTLLTKNASSAANLAGKVSKLVNSLGGGKKAASIVGEGLLALEQAIAFDLTSQGSAAMGMGEFFGAKGAEKVLELLSKGKSAKFMKFIKPLVRIAGSTTAGQVEEYSGEYLEQAFRNGFLSKETFRNTFGRNYDEAKDKFLMTLILVGTFGTGAEVGNMYKLGKAYYKDSGDQTQLNDVEKAFNEIQNAKKEEVGERFDDMSEAELEQFAKDNNVDISELKKTIEAAKKPEEGQTLEDVSEEDTETTEVEPGDITAKSEEVVEEKATDIPENQSSKERLNRRSKEEKSLFPDILEKTNSLSASKSTISDFTKSENGKPTAVYVNRKGEVDVVITGSKDSKSTDMVSFKRVYNKSGLESTNQFTSKFQIQSKDANFKQMLKDAQEKLPENHEWVENKSISIDGLRVFNKSLNFGYTTKKDSDGNVVTRDTPINIATKENVDTKGEGAFNTFESSSKEEANKKAEEVKKAFPGIEVEIETKSRGPLKGYKVISKLPVLVLSESSKQKIKIESRKKELALEASKKAKEPTIDTTTEEAVSEEESILSEDLEALEDEVSDALGDTFKDNIGETVTYNGEVGVLKQEGQSLVVENNNKIQVLGNIDELSNKPISSMKVKQGGELEAETADVTKDVPSDLITEIDGVPHRIVNARTRKGEPYVTVKNLETGIQNKISGEEGKPLLDQFKSYKGRKRGEAKAEAKARTEEEYNALSQEQKDKEQKDFDALVEKEVKAEQELESKMKEEESLESNLKKEEEAITKEAEELKDLGEQELEEEVKKLRKKALVISNKQGDFLVKKKPDGSYSVSKKNQETGRYVPFTGKSNVKKRAELVDQFNKEISKAESKKIDESAELSESIEKDKRDAIEKALDKVIEATSMKGNNAYNNILGVPINIAHGALKIVKASYKVSRDLSKAVQQGINSMTSNGYNVNEVEFKKFVINEIKAGNKKIEIAKKQKQKENKKNEQKKKREERKKTLKDESKSEKIKREAEESRKRDADLEASLNSLIEDALGTKKPVTKRDVTKIQKRFKDFISANKQILREASPALNATIANKIASVSSPATLKSTAEYISKITKDTKFKKEQEARVKLIEDIKKELQDKSFSRKGSAPRQGKIASEIQDFLKKVRQKLDYTQEMASKERGVILNSISDIDDMTIDKKRMLLALSFADIENKSKEELDNLTQLLKEYKKEGRELLSEKKAARSKKYQEGIDDLLTAILAGDKEVSPNVSNASTKSNLAAIASRFSGVAKVYNRIVNQTENWAGLINNLNRLTGKKAGGREKARDFLKDKFITPVKKAAYNKTKNAMAIYDSIEENKKSIFGKDVAAVNKDLNKKIFIRDANGNKIPSGKKGEYVTITKGRAMAIYNMQRDSSLEATLDEMNKTKDKILIDESNNIMSENPKLREYADWVHNNFYPNYQPRINKEYRKHYDHDLAMREDFSPIRRLDVDPADVNMLSPTQNIASTLNGSLIERVNNTKPLDLSKSLDETMFSYIDSMEHFIAYTDVIKFLNKTLKNQRVKEVIKQKYGSKVNQIIDKAISDLANKPKKDSATIEILSKIRKNITTAILGGNLPSAIKQLTSAPAYSVAEGVDTTDWVKQSSLMLTTKEGRKDLLDIWNSPYVRNRLKTTGFSRDTALSFTQDVDELSSRGTSIRNLSMFMTKYGDVGAILIGGTPYYMSMKKKYIKEGMSEAEAKDKAMFDFVNATEETQQSSAVHELSNLQRGSEFFKIFTMFKTSQSQYLRKGFYSPMRNLAKGRGTVQDIKNIAMFQVILPSLFGLVTKGLLPIKRLLEDDDEFDKDLKDLGKDVVFGNFGGLPFVGESVKAYLQYVDEDGKRRASTGFNSPAIEGVSKLTNAFAKATADLLEEEDFDTEEFFEDLLIPLVEMRTGFPVNNAKKLTKDNLERIGKGNFSHEKLMKYLGWSDYSLGIDKKEKTRLEKKIEKRKKRSNSEERLKSKLKARKEAREKRMNR
jgi:hypothetical protein